MSSNDLGSTPGNAPKTAADGSEQGPTTAPDNIAVSLRAFDTEENARAFGNLIAVYAREISRHINLERLDGITVAYDYEQALLELDRGYPASIQLTPSKDRVIGVAMSPGVLRDGIYKRHLVFHAPYVLPLQEPEHEFHGLAFHTFAHECAHVEVAAAYDRAFPQVLLRQQHRGRLDAMRSDVIFACWDEYATCWIVAGMGADPLPGYQQTLLEVLGDTCSRANACIRAYRRHGDVEHLLQEVCGLYGDLLKFASYFAGTLVGQGKVLADIPVAEKAIGDSWFAPYFNRLLMVMADLTDSWPNWQDEAQFQAIADIFIDMVEAGGIEMTAMDDGGIYANVPFSLATL